ncbi:MAG: DUF2752 domain-containing protein [Ignavibacteriota bacterium]
MFIPLLFYIIPISFQDRFGSICLIKRATGLECWGCGTRHALYAIMNLDFLKAWYYNKLSFVVFPVLVYLWFKYVIREYKNISTVINRKHSPTQVV